MQPEIKALLFAMTEFNPFFRQSANEMLHAEMFSSVQGLSAAFLAKEKIHLDVDQDDVFDYEAGMNVKYSKNEIITQI